MPTEQKLSALAGDTFRTSWSHTERTPIFVLLLVLINSVAFGPPIVAQEQMPSTTFEAIAWLEQARNTIEKNGNGDVVKIVIDYVPEVFVVGDLDIFPQLEVLEINYTGQFYDRHMSGIARLTSLRKFEVDYCEEISEASLSVLRYLPNLNEVVLHNCESVYSLKALGDCRTLKKIDLSSNEHLNFDVLKSLQRLPNLETLVLSENASLEDRHLRWITEMPKLKEVRMSNCSELTDDVLRHFSTMKNLIVLDVSFNPKITGESLGSINGESLEELYIDSCSLNDEALANLAHLKQLKKIRMVDNASIEGTGLSVLRNFDRLEELWLNGFRVTDEQLCLLDGIESLKTVSLDGCRLVSGAGLKGLSNSKGLEQLSLSRCRRIDDEDVLEICKFEQLKRLDLSGTKVKPAGIKQLKRLTKLADLDVSNCNWVNDDALQTIAQLPGLKRLKLERVPRLTDASLEYLAGSKSLDWLLIQENKNITGAGFAAFPDDSPLRELEVRLVQNLSPQGLHHLTRLTSLEELTLQMNTVSNAHLESLMGMPRLRQIRIEGDFDNSVYRRLIQSLPGVERDQD